MLLPFQLTKEEKTQKIDDLEKWCNTSVMSRKSLGILSRSFHVGTPLMMILTLLMAGQFLATISAICLILVGIMFYRFNGCFLSMLENRLCDDDFTIADPILEALHLDAVNENRLVGTYMVAITFTVVYFTIYYIRFL